MYDELVKELRDSAEWADRLAVLMGRAEGDTHAPIMRKAADAIEELQKRVPQRPHGRLIDADALMAWFEEWYDPNADLEICHVIDILDDNSVTPTIIEAEEGE